MNLFELLTMAIFHESVVRQTQSFLRLRLTSKAVPPSVRTSSSPSSFARSMISSDAPWNTAQGVNSTVARGKLRSDHPPGIVSIDKQGRWAS
jgi:hypothetical protein